MAIRHIFAAELEAPYK